MSSLGGSTNIKTQINNLWGAIRNLKGTGGGGGGGSGNVVYSGNDTPATVGQHYTISSTDGLNCVKSDISENEGVISFNNDNLQQINNITANKFIVNGGEKTQYLLANGDTLTQSAVSGNSNYYLYKNNSTSPGIPPPNDGEIVFNTSNQAEATEIYISHLTHNNFDIEVFYSQITELNDIYIQDQSYSYNYVKYNITGTPTIHSNDYITIPVVYAGGGGTGMSTFGDANVMVSFFSNLSEIDIRLSDLETKTQHQIVELTNQTQFKSDINLTGNKLINCSGVDLKNGTFNVGCNNTDTYSSVDANVLCGNNNTIHDNEQVIFGSNNSIQLASNETTVIGQCNQNIKSFKGTIVGFNNSANNTGNGHMNHCIGNDNTCNGYNASAFGSNITNNIWHSICLGDNAISTIYPNSLNCDLGLANKPYKDIYVSGIIKNTDTNSNYLTTDTANNTYLTQTNASSTYQPMASMSNYQLQSDMSAYLTTTTASNTYLTQTNASSTYQPKSLMSNYQLQSGMGAYLTTSTASSTYLTQNNASSTYQPMSSMSNYQLQSGMGAYLTTDTASTTYLTQGNASLTYQPKSLMTNYQLQSGMGAYLTTASATSTYQPISSMGAYQLSSGMGVYLKTANASTTYQPISLMGNYVQNPDLTSTLSDYVQNSALTTTLSDYVESSTLSTTLTDYLSKSVGGTMAAAITMGTNPINTSQTSFTSGQLVSKSYVDTAVSTLYLAVLTTQTAFNNLATNGYYINMVTGLTGLTGSSLGCAFYRSVSGVCSVTLTYNQLPPSINMYDFTMSGYNCWVKTKSGVGWVVVDQSAYLPLAGNVTMTGPITMGTNAINTTQSTFTSGQLVSKNYVDTSTTFVKCPTADLGLKIVRGANIINGSATAVNGNGFSTVWSSTNNRQVITWSPAFSNANYTFLNTSYGGIPYTTSKTAGELQIFWADWQNNGVPKWSISFDFIAIGT